MAETKKLQVKLDVHKGSKNEQVSALTIENLKEELERVDKRYEDLKAKNTRMVQIQVDHATEMG